MRYSWSLLSIASDLVLYLLWDGHQTVFNREADDLANGRVQAFDPAVEVKFKPRELSWHILYEVTWARWCYFIVFRGASGIRMLRQWSGCVSARVLGTRCGWVSMHFLSDVAPRVAQYVVHEVGTVWLW